MQTEFYKSEFDAFGLEHSWGLIYFSASWCAPCKHMLPVMRN